MVRMPKSLPDRSTYLETYRGYNIYEDQFYRYYYHGIAHGPGGTSTSVTGKSLESVKKAIDRRAGRGGSRRGRARENPISPDTQKWLLIGVGGAVLAGIAYALYAANKAPTVMGQSAPSVPFQPPQSIPVFPPAPQPQPTAPSNVITPTGTNLVSLQPTARVTGEPTPVTGGDVVPLGPGF